MTAPFVRRDWLAQARERAGHSQESLARHIGVSTKAISYWERGASTPKPVNRPALAKTLGFTMDELCRRLDLDCAPEPAALDGNGAGFSFGAAREWLSLMVRAEMAANAIWTVVTHAFPALCQTDGYARAVEHSSHRPLHTDDVDELVRARLARAEALTTADYTALIAAPLLDAIQGDADVMADQLAHLLALTERPNVTLLIIDTEHLAAIAAPFTLIAQAGDMPDLVAEAGHVGPFYAEGPAAAADLAALFQHLASLARDREASRTAIAKAADRFAAMAATTKRGTR